MRAAAADPRQTSFAVLREDVLLAIDEEKEVVLGKLREARRRGEDMTAAELQSSLTTLSSIRDRVTRLGLR